ncbi:MAG: malonyl-CoA decarboxylase family protein, partial [Thiohalophilus sp.]
MAGRWFTRVLDGIADRGLDLFRKSGAEKTPGDIAGLCHALLTGKGEASGIALSREILSIYQSLSPTDKVDFFRLLAEEFSADPNEIQQATESYLASRSHENFQRLSHAVEPPRQEMFRRLNMAPNATAQLVRMRGDLIALLREHPELAPVDADFRHILASWFNRGFLQLEKIDWYTPAHILEKLISYEAVHAIRGWDDLRRRLMDDRRCFAFFHPALPDDPLIFVEVALVQGIPDDIQPLLDINSDTLPVTEADTAAFYSINNTLPGLRGISFGNFLIKQVLEELQVECPWIKQFVTLSPMPRFAATLTAAIEGKRDELTPAYLEEILKPTMENVSNSGSGTSLAQNWLQHMQESSGDEALFEATRLLCLAYLTHWRKRGGVL